MDCRENDLRFSFDHLPVYKTSTEKSFVFEGNWKSSDGFSNGFREMDHHLQLSYEKKKSSYFPLLY